MTSHWITWLLAGALGASVTMHFLARPGSDLPIDLTDEQRQIAAACCGPTCNPATESGAQRALRDLVAALRADEPDEARVLELGEVLAEAQAQAVRDCVQGALKLRAVLTPEQIETLRSCCPLERD